MTGKLDQIEAKLKSFFEKSARLAPQQQQLHIAEQLVVAMRTAIEDEPEGGLSAPGAYVLRMHPQALAIWEENPHLLDELTDALRNAAREACIRFQNPLAIHLAEDADLDPDTVKISLDKSANKLEETARHVFENRNLGQRRHSTPNQRLSHSQRQARHPSHHTCGEPGTHAGQSGRH